MHGHGRHILALKGDSSLSGRTTPTTILNEVVLPAPFGPRSPQFHRVLPAGRRRRQPFCLVASRSPVVSGRAQFRRSYRQCIIHHHFQPAPGFIFGNHPFQTVCYALGSERATFGQGHIFHHRSVWRQLSKDSWIAFQFNELGKGLKTASSPDALPFGCSIRTSVWALAPSSCPVSGENQLCME